MRRLPRRAAPLALGLLAAWLLSPAAAGAEPPVGGEPLALRAAREGAVRVIVTLSEGARVDSRQTRRARRLARRAIRRAQDEVLSEVERSGAGNVRRFGRRAAFALDATPRTLEKLARSRAVASIQEDRLMAPVLSESVPIVEADLAGFAGFDGTGWSVAVLDTGVDVSHPFLVGRVAHEACFSAGGSCPDGATTAFGPGAAVYCETTSCFHGTHVAGIAAGATGTFRGVAPGASIVAVNVFSILTGAVCNGTGEDPCALAFTSDLISALEYVLDLAETTQIAAANMSLGGGSWTSQAACDAANASLKGVIDDLRAVGIATVAASGNDGLLDALSSPACISSAISVGATNDSDLVASFSNSAPFLSLLAPGVSITSAVPPDLLGFSWGVASGTSMATPHVAGAWALVRHANPAAGVDEVLSALQTTGVPITDVNEVTTPRIRVWQAIQQAGIASTCSGLDDDGDGVPAACDNCAAVANEDQADADQDGYGNACDADYDQNGITGSSDFSIFRAAFNTSVGDPTYEPAADHNGDGTVGAEDFGTMKSYFGIGPGPSGLDCAGAVPCTAD